jgi:archaemetzincin
MPGDWLAEHPEIGESFAGYVGDPGGRPTAERRTIYVQPMGRPAADLSVVRDLTEAWFGLPVTVLPTVTVERVNPTIRDGQLLTTDIMAWLYGRLPDDAVALVALTGTDLYPDPVWNYVFGQASLTHRVGVWSTARFGEPGSLEARRRLAKIMLHELGHMVGMPHCVWNHCLMNGSNDLTEADRAPLFLGPVCLHKLLWATDQTPTERYRVLAEAYTRHGLDAEAAWVRGRLEAAAR